MQYRPDIDGLRALAIVPVLLYHLDVDPFSGGFVGVDIFFVISGFLITSIITSKLESDSFSLLDFYRRRALRILPPFVVVLAATAGAAYFIMLPSEVAELGDTTLAAALFFSNVHFWNSVDYFNPNSDTNPLLHTWSLAVEEQFYIVVPLVLMAARRWIWRWRQPLFVAAVVLSFALSVLAVRRDPAATFYLLPTRFWEMGAGSLLAFAGPRARIQGTRAEWAAALGAIMIAISVFSLDSASVFPAHNAVLPVAGTALLLVAGQSSRVGALLALRAPVAIGKVSYSLYLWHWPLIVFYKLRVGPELGVTATIGLGLVSILLSVASYYVVEQPFRHLRPAISSQRILLGAAAALALLSVGGVALRGSSADWRDYPDGVVALADFETYDESDAYQDQFREGSCFLTSRTSGGYGAFDQDACLGQVGGYTLIGDSHGAHLAGPLTDALGAHSDQLSLNQATSSGCKPTVGTEGEPRCTDLMSFMFDTWIPEQSPKRVILSARWQHADIESLLETVDYLFANGTDELVVLGPTVEYFGSTPALLARDALAGTSSIDSFRDPSRALVDDALRQRLPLDKVRYVSVHDLLCPAGVCRTMFDGDPAQFDYGHLSVSAADFVAQGVIERIS